MASAFVAFLLLPFYFTAAAAATSSNNSHVNLNSQIHANIEPRAWYSPSRRFAFGFLPRGTGFLVGIWIVDYTNDTNSQNITVWTANRDRPPVSSNAMIELTRDGKLVLNADNGEIRIADPPEAVAFASMHDSGNFVLYGKSSNAIWQSFDFPTDTILGGQRLPGDHKLFSKVSSSDFSTGRFRLDMQLDGNLVAYPAEIVDGPTDAYWSTNTNDYSFTHGQYYLHLDDAGRLKVEEGEFNSTVIKQLNGNYSENTGTTIYRATLDPDGNFRLYRDTSTDQLWQAFNDTCQPKGLCGFNSYCTVNDLNPWCQCVPGTDFINSGERYDGCRRNFTKQKCTGGNADTTFYYITTEKKLKWEDFPYFNAPMSEEDCKKSCLDDCYCDAAEYDSKICNKHKFPLRYVSRDPQKSSTTFFKIGTRRIEHRNRTIGPELVEVVPPSKRTWLLILLLTVSLVTYSCATLATFGVFIFKTRVIKYKRLLASRTSGLAKELTLRLYSYNELKEATKGFKEELGKGSFGAVYKGNLNNGEKLVAVKRLQKLVEEGEREFQSEMRAIGKTHHRNLVRLLGYCTEGSNRLLVYEYMSNGSLADLLFRSEMRPNWQERVRIAIDVAKGILYLHEECEAPIIHCDIKPQNILLDEFWTAKISDFGLAKLLMPDQTRTMTDTRGTRGYVAPEWQKNMPISLKVDVYSYGIVLLEIICCRRNIDLSVSRPEEIQLSGWAYSCFAAGELGKLVRNEGVDKNSLERMVSIALWCIQSDPIVRPSMKGVVLMLEGFTNISTPPCPTA
ncbi:Serine/threonine protein kinase [Handroanthus impetiginosus]|uniref:Receptor-like serine/threonine-protein kinase n=1 Tax=Handroanthus impetiginosus TaxID=429701 RepID=A0A2G9HQH8_9LAMI|nr:Serine/threonine protein kinase [Handroanthus impetiginosus]